MGRSNMSGIAAWTIFHGRYRPNAPFIVYDGEVTTWGAFEQRTAEFAAGLAAVGVRRGSRVGALMRNHAAFFEVVVATARLGAVFVPLNVRLTPHELSYIMSHAEVGTLITDSSFVDVIGKIDPMPPSERVFFVDKPPNGGRAWDELRQHGRAPVATDITRDTPACICYTSGTTGLPKGAVLTHGNASAVAAAMIASDGLGPSDRAIVPVPLAFTGSFFTIGMPFMKAGGSMLIRRELHPESLLDDIEHNGITYIAGVPIVFDAMAKSPGFERRNLSKLRTAKIGGAPVPESLIEAWHVRGVGLVGAFGITEGGGYNIQLPAHDAVRKLGFAGLPVMDQQCRIVDEDGRDVPVGKVGELVIAGEVVMLEYLKEPEITADTIRDGWLRTGDLALMDEEGYYKVVDRKKDMIITGGLNVYPSEIERVLITHPDIRELAVIGVPHPKWGETPLACVVTSNPKLTLEQLNEFAADQLADYKRPRFLELVASLPRTMSGKVLKRELRTEIMGRLESKRTSAK